ncbi:hypothetical protein IQ241_05390 [Romeria aff. gracilis LEGE 07310]|uniref:Uncharacterized protein n=1 Tax=Vasconcelosia minhoensis LEGE 07310 TaxID=915328 RepID=A0A8J7A6D9_9CYAN|nr:hypothetical protein [Romeria gracilis]MBE9076735.1 hypothetical protein [Romeria aff. gracilis LEGE 07310]
MPKLPKSVACVLLLLILIIPFVLLELRGIEAYPAVLLPSGDRVVTTSDGIVTFGMTELVAVHSDGQEEIIDPQAFFGNIPIDYWQPIARRGFGLDPEVITSFSLGVWTLSAKFSPQANAQQQQQLQAWMNQRLEFLNLKDIETVRVRYPKVFFDIDSQTEVSREVTRYFDYELD